MLVDAIRGRDNNFDLIRTVAALLVILSHSFTLVGSDFEPGKCLTGAYPSSTIAVHAFFIISGFLIAKSWADRPNLWVFATKRLARILPAYALVVVASALVLGPLVTTLPVGDYFRSGLTRSYITNNLLFYKMQFVLPGVFGDLKLPQAVNGSIWSLTVEMYLYVCVPLLGVFGHVLGTRARPLLLVLVAGLLLADWHYFATPERTSLVMFYLIVRVSLQCSACFAVGACYFVYRESIPLTKSLAAVAAVLYVGSWHTPHAKVFSFVCLPYLVFSLAYTPSRIGRRFAQWGDPSFGLYVYAFPIQQIIVHLFRDVSPTMLLGLSVITVTPISYLSWHYLEKPILHFVRDRLRRPDAGSEPGRLRLAA